MAEATVRISSVERRDELFAAFAQAMEGNQGSFPELERAGLQLANELVRRWTQATLERIERQYGDELLVDGQRYRRHSEGVRKYHSLCGAVEVRRSTYRLVGVHNGPTVVPLELEAGLMENATPALAASVLQGFATMPLRDYEAEMGAAYRVPPSRSTLERIGKRIGSVTRDHLVTIEHVVRAKETIPHDARSISIGLDRTTIPMAEPTGAPAPSTKRVRRRPAPVAVNYRMAYLATLAFNDRDGNTITSLRIAATAHEGPVDLLDRLAIEVRHVLAQRALPLVIIQDGAPELWNLIEAWLTDHGFRAASKLIDRYHLDERLGEVCGVFTSTAAQRARLFAKWRDNIDRSAVAMARISHQIERWVNGWGNDDLPWPDTPPVIRGYGAHIAREHNKYFRGCKGKLNYAKARRRGFPVGSGVTEGACKSVVSARFKRSGQRWSEVGAAPCILLRTLHLNGRLRGVFEHLLEERRHGLQCL